jgi:microcystin-dependent protein
MANAALLGTIGDQTSSQVAGAIAQLMPSGVILPYGGEIAPTGWLFCDGSAISRITYANLFAALGTSHGYGDNSTTFNLPDLRGRFMRGVDGTASRDPDKVARTAAAVGGNTGNNVGSVQTNATAKNGLTASAASVATSVSGLKNQLNGTSGGMSANSTHGHGISDPGHGHAHGVDTTGGYAVGLPISATYGSSSTYDIGEWSDRAPNYWHSGFVGGNTTGISVNTSGSLAHTHSWDFGSSATFSASGTTPAQTVTVGNGDNETRPLNINVHYIIKV